MKKLLGSLVCALSAFGCLHGTPGIVQYYPSRLDLAVITSAESYILTDAQLKEVFNLTDDEFSEVIQEYRQIKLNIEQTLDAFRNQPMNLDHHQAIIEIFPQLLTLQDQTHLQTSSNIKSLIVVGCNLALISAGFRPVEQFLEKMIAIEKIPSDVTADLGELLHFAIELGAKSPEASNDLIDFLLHTCNVGPDIKTATKTYTPLGHAIDKGLILATKTLLAANANTDEVTYRNRTFRAHTLTPIVVVELRHNEALKEQMIDALIPWVDFSKEPQVARGKIALGHAHLIIRKSRYHDSIETILQEVHNQSLPTDLIHLVNSFAYGEENQSERTTQAQLLERAKNKTIRFEIVSYLSAVTWLLILQLLSQTSLPTTIAFTPILFHVLLQLCPQNI